MSRRTVVLSLLLAACTGGPGAFDTDKLSSGDTDDTDVPDIVYPDRDGDGSTSDEDCDDQNPLVNPDQEEICNGADDDCDGLSDATSSEKEGFTAAFQDADVDTYGGDSTQRWFCTVPSDWTLRGGDCDDDNAGRNPGAIEVCNGVDDDCDAQTDDDDPSLVAAGHPTAVQRFPDVDRDGFGAGTQRWYCVAPVTGTAPNGTDCDDADGTAFPGSAEKESSTSCRKDADGDGYGSKTAPPGGTAGTDCDDTLAAAFPGSAERESSSSCRLDADGDGYGAASPPSAVSVGGDCDDGRAAVNPGASEVWYDGTDANCDARDDWDQDGDGAPALSKPGGGTDCNDTSPAIKPTATEICNGIDDDCDTKIDDADSSVSVTAPWYLDNDGDGFAGTVVRTCTQPVGGVSTGSDCDDTEPTTFPGAAEKQSTTACYADRDGDGWGNAFAPSPVPRGTDCDDDVATTFPGSAERESTTSCRSDADGDGFGAKVPVSNVTAGGDCDDSDVLTFPGSAELESSSACRRDADGDGYGSTTSPPGGSAGGDCNDAATAIRPGVTEVWYDGTDQNCDGRDDWDQDGDGAPAVSKPGGGTDCLDTDASIKPTALELCDGKDNDCDELIDDADGNVSVTVFWYIDTDGDLFAGSANPVRTCAQPPGGVRLAQATDCDDTKATTFPGSAERESSTSCRADADGDGYGSVTAPPGGSAGGDCDDTVATTFPGAAERESSSSCRADADNDGYGSVTKPASVTAGGDCDDTSAVTFPGAAERESSSSCRLDADGDGYGAVVKPAAVTAGGDCDDAVVTTFPGAAQVESSSACRADADDDGYGSTTAPSGGTAGGDCDDAVAAVKPGATEVWYDGVDQNCDARDDWDRDGDTYPALTKPGGGTDCDDVEAAVNPAAVEVCNVRDDDCDALTDDADGSVVVTQPWGEDLDGDGMPGADTLFEVCDPPSPDLLRLTGTNEDCDDQDDRTYIGAAFRESMSACMTDADEDGWGSDLPLAGIDVGTDCDDLVATTFPLATDPWYDGVDQDCRNNDDYDRDGDGRRVSSAPGGGTDCDDASATTYPGAPEIVGNGIDENCTGADQVCGGSAADPFATCKAARTAGCSSSGVFWIKPGAGDAYQAYCGMSLDGGGWTMVALVADDGQNTWTWDSRALWSTSTTLFGSPSDATKDHRSQAFLDLAFRDVAFVHEPSGVNAVYNAVSDGTKTLGAFIDGQGAGSARCWSGVSGYPMSTGGLAVGGTGRYVCETRLYFNPVDQAGTSACVSGSDAYGPAWSISSTTSSSGCPMNQPGTYASLGPDQSAPALERTVLGFGAARGLNTGAVGTGANRIRVFVR